MHQLILDEIVAVCERRRKDGDFPVDPQPNAEHMEDAILDLTTKLAAAEERVKELTERLEKSESIGNECVIGGKSSSELNNIVYKALNKL